MISIKKMLNPKKRIAGLDIGNSYIKIMEFEGDDLESARLINYYIEQIPSKFKSIGSQDDVQVEQISDFGEFIKNAWRRSGVSTKNVALCMPNAGTMIKKVDAEMYDDDESMQVQMDALMVDSLPSGVAKESIKMDYFILKNTINEENKKRKTCKVVLVTAKADYVEDRIATVESAGLVPAILDIEQLAYLNLLRTFRGDDFLKKNYILLDCSAESTRLTLFSNGEVIGEKIINLGSSYITQNIMQDTGMSYEEVEIAKIKKELDGTLSIHERNYLENLGGEIQSELSSMILESRISEIEEFLLIGGGVIVDGMVDEIEKITEDGYVGSKVKFNNRPEIFRPLELVDKSEEINLKKLKEDEPSLCLVTSLAMRYLLRSY